MLQRFLAGLKSRRELRRRHDAERETQRRFDEWIADLKAGVGPSSAATTAAIRAAAALGKSGDRRCFKELVFAMRQSTDERGGFLVGEAAAKALGVALSLADDDAIGDLRAQVEQQPKSRISAAAMSSLGQLQDEGAVDVLVNALSLGSLAAADALCCIGTDAAMKGLVRYWGTIARSKDKPVLDKVAIALKNRGTATVVEPLLGYWHYGAAAPHLLSDILSSIVTRCVRDCSSRVLERVASLPPLEFLSENFDRRLIDLEDGAQELPRDQIHLTGLKALAQRELQRRSDGQSEQHSAQNGRL